ncbi:MAG: thiamine-phosphate kinase [Acidobacteriota bacterium]
MKSEFEFIQNIKKKYSLNLIGDDCAVLPKDDKTDMVITADMLVEDIDFRLEWTTPEFLGQKALAVSLSDIAAMGAEPKWAMLSIAVPEDSWNGDFVDRFYIGWHKLAREFEVELVGGDISRAPDKLVIDSIVTGEVAKGRAILRSGARAGDALFVSGCLGGAAAGLRILERGIVERTNLLVERQLRPFPRLSLSKDLNMNSIVSSMIDISDGLSSDLMHICIASQVGARIDLLPIDEELGQYFSSDESFQFALNGGEDFELLFTSRPEKISALENLPAVCIGEITPNVGIIELIHNGKTEILQPKGYRHF